MPLDPPEPRWTPTPDHETYALHLWEILAILGSIALVGAVLMLALHVMVGWP